MTLCKKGGGLRKKSNFECVNKNDILIGGRGSKPMSLFQDVSKIKVILWKRINFQQIKDQFFANCQTLTRGHQVNMIFVYNLRYF